MGVVIIGRGPKSPSVSDGWHQPLAPQFLKGRIASEAMVSYVEQRWEKVTSGFQDNETGV